MAVKRSFVYTGVSSRTDARLAPLSYEAQIKDPTLQLYLDVVFVELFKLNFTHAGELAVPNFHTGERIIDGPDESAVVIPPYGLFELVMRRFHSTVSDAARRLTLEAIESNQLFLRIASESLGYAEDGVDWSITLLLRRPETSIELDARSKWIDKARTTYAKRIAARQKTK